MRTAAGHVGAAGGVAGGWQGAAASAATAASRAHQAELEIIAAQAQSHSTALSRYAVEVETIQHQQASIESSRASVAMQIGSTQRRLIAETDNLRLDPTASPAPVNQLQSRLESLSSRAGSLDAQFAALTHQRAAADNTAVMGLTSADSWGGLSRFTAKLGTGAGATSGPLAVVDLDIGLNELAALTETELMALFLLHPSLAHQLRTSLSPQEVANWWSSLDAQQQTTLVLGAPVLIGALGGVSPLGRVAANRVNAVARNAWLATRIAELEKVKGQASSGGFPTPRADAQAELDKLRAERDYLLDVITGRVQLYLYDPDSHSIIEMIGTPGPATTAMMTYVPGTFTSEFSFYDGSAQQVGRWLNKQDPGIVTFVWKEGLFPGEDIATGGTDVSRIFEANEEGRAVKAGADLARFRSEVLTSSPTLAASLQLGMGHSWGLLPVTSSESGDAHYDQVHSLAGAGMTEAWERDEGTEYYHWAYTDFLTMLQETGMVWDGKIPANDPAFTSRVFEREGDFTLYLPQPVSPGGVQFNPPPSIPATTNAEENHSLIASERPENRDALYEMLDAVQGGGTR
ncbi:hypothetical protein [Microbacterium arborescens]